MVAAHSRRRSVVAYILVAVAYYVSSTAFASYGVPARLPGHAQKASLLTRLAASKDEALETLAASALEEESREPQEVFEAIRLLEKAKDKEGVSGFADKLTGDWRLIYTTGTSQTEKQVGRINYVPIVAVQRFDMDKEFIRNGVYFGPLSLEFEGSLRWIEDQRRLEFDFEVLKVCGFSLDLPDWARSALGMKSSAPYKRQPAFNFVAADGTVIAARGAGGGVALWVRSDLKS
mmetsp:Transcript_4357/g.10677  ORF Transcript_4357/g.10677 Transcript_4357/m.10677 type:complete len:233 (-) Transcript_4357:138-836(-)